MNKMQSQAIVFIVALIALVQVDLTVCQTFDPSLNDEEFLNITGRKVKHEVVTMRQELMEQVEMVRVATKAYIGAKIKENIFKALRDIAEKEMDAMSMQNRPRQPRQDEDDDDETTTERGILPQLATVVQAIFGNNVNVTKYVENASKLLPRPIGNQLVGVASLLDPKQFITTESPTREGVQPITPAPVNPTGKLNDSVSETPVGVSLPPTLRPLVNVSAFVTQGPVLPPSQSQTKSPTNKVDEDEDDGVRSEEESETDSDDSRGLRRRVKRQFDFKGINPMKILDGFEAIWKNYGNNENATTIGTTTIAPKKYSKGGSTTESDDGFDDDYTTKPSRVITAVSGLGTQMDALRKGVPDLFQGAREAYKFLEHLNGFLDTWENRLQGAGDDDE